MRVQAATSSARVSLARDLMVIPCSPASIQHETPVMKSACGQRLGRGLLDSGERRTYLRGSLSTHRARVLIASKTAAPTRNLSRVHTHEETYGQNQVSPLA